MGRVGGYVYTSHFTDLGEEGAQRRHLQHLQQNGCVGERGKGRERERGLWKGVGRDPEGEAVGNIETVSTSLLTLMVRFGGCCVEGLWML